jgi:hypothetical protein
VEVDVAGEDLGDLDRDGSGMRASSVAANSEDWMTPLTSRVEPPGARSRCWIREAIVGFLDDQALEVAVVVGAVQRALRRSRRLSWEASTRTLRPRDPSRLWRAVLVAAQVGCGDRVVDAQAFEQAVGGVGGAGQLGAVQAKRVGVASSSPGPASAAARPIR